jgi:hypothetical protein
VVQESSVIQESSMTPESHQDLHKEVVPKDSDAYLRWRLAWEKQWVQEDKRIQELDRRIDRLKNTLPQRGSGSRSPSPGPSSR